jgi:HPt (histidine-containing phosphotransfer) domain-containing protein
MSGAEHRALPFRGKRVLAVLKEQTARESACQALQTLGASADAVDSASAALERHRSQACDLMLLDEAIVAENDFAIMPPLRAATTRRVPLIACVGDISEARRNAILCADLDDVCAYPLVPTQLSRLLHLWLPPGNDDQAGNTGSDLRSVACLLGPSFSDILAMFRRDSEERLAALNLAMKANDSAQLAKLAHALGGSAASIGGWRMAGLCRALEMQCLAQRRARWPQLLDAIDLEYRGLLNALEALRQEQGNTAQRQAR